MDDASSVPSMSQGPNGMNGPSDNGFDGSMPQDAPMGDMGMDPNTAPDMGMPDGADNAEGSGDDTMSLFNQLCDKDKETARKYIQSMIDDQEGDIPDDMGGEMEDPSMQGEPNPNMPMESIVFTKKQLVKINENLAALDDNEKQEKPLGKKKEVDNKHKTPFSSPFTK